MADVRRRSGASVGSIYHHFAGKEELAAALLVEGLREYQAGLLAVLEGAGDAEAAVRGAVAHHLDWVEARPDLARMLLAPRDPAVRLAGQAPLRELNRPFFAAVEAWRRR